MAKKKVQDESIDNINEYNPYEVDKLSKIPSVVKIIFKILGSCGCRIFYGNK